MDKLKKHLKILIGAAVLILFAVVFFLLNQSGNLETGNMKHWRATSIERRSSAIKILTGTEEHTGLMVQCMDKIAALPDSSDMPVKDAASLCFVGIQLKDNI